MLAKVISLTGSAAGKNIGFGSPVRYIFRDGGEKAGQGIVEGGQFNLDCLIDTPEDREVAIELMDGDSKKASRIGRFKGNPVYHFQISWPADENPTAKQIRESVEHTLKELGMHECQAVYAIHRDTDNVHVHTIVNRIHPETGKVLGPPYRDYLVLDKAMRQLELAQGWKHDVGPYSVTTNTKGEPVIARTTVNQKKERPSQSAVRGERNSGAPSFQRWAKETLSPEIDRILKDPKASWADIHSALGKHGCRIEEKGSGLVIATDMGKRTLTVKASQVHRQIAKTAAEKRLGKYYAPVFKTEAIKEKTYLHCVREHQQTIKHDSPGRTGRGEQREAKRLERAAARQELHDRFKEEQGDVKHQWQVKRKEMYARHKAERSALHAELKNGKAAFIADLKQAGVVGPAAYSLWSREQIIRRDALQVKQKEEREQFKVDQPKGLVWRKWLEKEAALGNEAARSALRGIQYRERGSVEPNSILGEELDPLKPSKKDVRAVAPQQSVTLATLTPEVNGHQSVIYKDEKGVRRMTDEGPRIVVHDKSDGTLETAIDLAGQKYGEEVYITGSAEFREEAARECARQGIYVADKDLQIIWNQERYDRDIDRNCVLR